jgi:hypothetical protein
MTRDETVALFLECEAKRAEARAAALAGGKDEYEARKIAHGAAKAKWNAWAKALLNKRGRMEAEGRWAAKKDIFGLEPKNTETRAWLEMAEADLSQCLFLANGIETTKRRTSADYELILKKIRLEKDADFSDFIFPGYTSFECSIFEAEGDFSHTAFKGNVSLRNATFSGITRFDSTVFEGEIQFESAAFKAFSLFVEVTFKGETSFQDACFDGPTSFKKCTFSDHARFKSTSFHGVAHFPGATFSSNVDFGTSTFKRAASFDGATFRGSAEFGSAAFSDTASFEGATFKCDVSYDRVTFERDVFFQKTRFDSAASFALCNFRQHASFEASRFGADASFEAIKGDRGFNMAHAVFDVVPDFIQAHFEEAPRLDNLEVGSKLPELKDIEDEDREKLSRRGRWHRRGLEKSARYRRLFEAVATDSDLRNIPARWRALKRLAIQGHDTERELEFHARELRSQRFAEDWPLPLAFWRGRVWAGWFRFWSGCFYEWFSDFGRSLARPLIASWVVLIAAAAFFLSQTDVMQRELAPREASYFSGTVRTARHALFNAVACYSPAPAPAASWRGAWPWWRRGAKLGPATSFDGSQTGGLIEPFRSQTNARAEALHLAFRNAFVVLDGSAEAAHRTFGCLYGVELYGGSNPLAIVPSAVSTVSAIQKLFSALMIFLFGLALRNMLKMK